MAHMPISTRSCEKTRRSSEVTLKIVVGLADFIPVQLLCPLASVIAQMYGPWFEGGDMVLPWPRGAHRHGMT
jgi:hypothetical protein